MSDVKQIGGRLQITPRKLRLGNIVAGVLPDEAVNMAQFNSLQQGTVDVTRIELASSGTAAAPAITWDGDTDTGLYRIGANNIGITANGSKVVDIATTGVTVTGVIVATTSITGTTSVITDLITPLTSGAGTSYLRPAGIKSTTPIVAADIKTGGVYGLSKADGLSVTLPAAATATIGSTFKFHILTDCTSVGYVFSKGEAGDVFVGGLWCTIANPDAANDMEFNIASGTVNTLTLGATTACGLAGGWVEFTCISATQWAVNGVVLGSGTLASNLFTTV